MVLVTLLFTVGAIGRSPKRSGPATLGNDIALVEKVRSRASLALQQTICRTGNGSMRHEPSFDGLRAVAIGGVVATHAGILGPGGGLGVEIFFALSGYLITRVLLDEEAHTGRIDLRRFFYRRTLRLMPALVAMVATVLTWAAFHGRVAERLFPSLMTLTYLMNFNRALEWGPQDPLGHSWSLAMEEQFYLLWPIVMLLVTSMRRRVVVLVALIGVICAWRGWLLLHGASIERVYNGLDTHSEVLLMGCLLAVGAPFVSCPIGRWATQTISVPIVAIAAQMFLFARDTPFAQGIGNIVIGLLAAWLIVALPSSTWPRRLLSLPPMRFVGRISYGLYLWHYPIFLLGGDLAIPHWRLIATPLTILVATMSFYGIERRFLRLRDRIHPPGASADLTY
jgi:peptidoglycan/LPS O-acetylase OafA/YrhL